MKKFLRYLIASGAAMAFGAFAADDVGLVNQLSGDVSYVSGGHTAKAKAFMKIREGDRFTLPSGSQVRVVYFHNGRQEAFKGAGTFTVGSQQSTVQNGAKPDITSLPSGVPQKLAQTPDLVQIARLGRSGGVAVRGAGREAPRLTPEQQQEIRQARQTYEQLRKAAAADDINPEYYLYSVLQDYLMYDDMKQVVDEMQKRRPSDPDVAVLTEYVKAKTGAK